MSTPPPTPPPPTPGAGPLPAPSPAERVQVAWQDRARTDYRFVHPWRNVLLMIVTCGIFAFFVFYQLVRRSRDHNRRRLELLDAATTAAWDEAYRRGLTDELRPSFERIAGHLQTLRSLTNEFRDPAIWLLISIVASTVAEIVAFVLLDGDLITHDRTEGAIEAELAVVYARLGQPLPDSDPARVKQPDNYVGRIVVAVVTCGIYMLWWFVDQQRDGDRHYDVNWPWEDHLAKAVRNLAAT